MNATHYHVTAGTVGCLGDDYQTFTRKSDAIRYARNEAADYREAGVMVSGNAETGYAIAPINYLVVESCDGRNCEAWMDCDEID